MKKIFDYILLNKPLISGRIINFINEKKEDDFNIPLYKDALGRLNDFALSGKMIRANLVLLSGEMFGVAKSDILDIACAVELIHSGLLIHDDIIDDDSLRRGNKTIFAQYAEGKDKFYGQSLAICVGDVAFFLAINLISESKLEALEKVNCITFLTSEIQKVAAAEMEDFNFGQQELDPSIEQILNMYKLKSARYTFSLPLVFGALIKNKTPEIINQIEDFGEKLGIVFQIVDDSLGITGDSEVTGKPVGNDIMQNKKTVFRKLLYEEANENQKTELDNIFGSKDMTKNKVKKIIDLANELGINEKIEKIVSDYSSEAKNILSKLNIQDKNKDFLSELIEYNIHRNK